ncbi:MAG: PD-(D/E)XK nuclease family protein, partial [Myxococcaceae bacterium]
MASSKKTLRVLPDGDRVEEELVETAAEGAGFVDASCFMTFSQLVARCEGARVLERRPVSPLTARVVLWSAARKLGVGPFGLYVHEPAFARTALALIVDLKAGAVSPQEFAEAIKETSPSRIDRGRYLSRLYAAYEETMAGLRLADREDELRGAVESLRTRGLPPALGRFGTIEISDLYDFTPLRLQWVTALAEACEKAEVLLRLKVPGAGNPHVDAAVDPVLAQLEKRGQTLRCFELEKLDAVERGRPLARVGHALFVPDSQAVDSEGALSLWSAGTAREEIRRIARQVRALVDQGVAPEEVAIAYRDLGEEAEWLTEALEEVGVPARLRRGAPLTSTAAGRVALELPLLVDDGYPAEAVARWLSSRYVPELSRGAPDSPGSWLKLASVRDNRLGAQGQKGAYEVRLGALAGRLARRSASAPAATVRGVLKRVLRLIELGDTLSPEARAFELLDRWWKCLQALELPKAVRQNEQQLSLALGERDRDSEATPFGRAILRALARDQAASEALLSMLTELDAALKLSGAGAQRMQRRTFHRWLMDAAADFNLSPKGTRGGAVRVLDVRELVGRRFQHVFVGGLVDGRFPGRDRGQPLFPDEDRAAINRTLKRDVFRLLNGELDGRLPWRLAEDRLLLHAALTASEGTVSLSYSRGGARGEAQVPSPFLEELTRRTGNRLSTFRLRPIPELDEVDTEGQLRERTALEALGRTELRLSAVDDAREALASRFEEEPWFRAAREKVRVEEERLRFFSMPDLPPGPFTGAIAGPALAPQLERIFQFGASKPLSASTLSRFGNCGYQGFLSYALRLEEPQEPGEELDNRGNGSYWHAVMEELIPRLREAGALGKSAEEIPDGLLNEALEQASRTAEQSWHVGHPALWRLSRDRARRMARKVFDASPRGLPFAQHQPEAMELHFGREGAPEAWREVALPPAHEHEAPIYLAGTIDRLDRHGSSVGVVDYKSGSLGSAGKLMEELLETEFQLPF